MDGTDTVANRHVTGIRGAAGSLSRRDFLLSGAAAGTFAASCISTEGERKVSNQPESPELSFGLVTDLHYADKPPWKTRYYRDSDEKLRECVETFNAGSLDFIVELGDFIDGGEKEAEIEYLRAIDGIFREFRGPRHYVLGNHDMASLSKDEFMAACGARRAYYSFDSSGWHFVILDANFNEDGSPYDSGNFDWTETYIPEAEQRWLAEDLAGAEGRKTIVFIHQILNDETDPHGVKNAPEVRRILEEAGNVPAVFQGHMHSGGYAEVNGIHYLTLRAAVEGPGVESNAWAIARLFPGGRLEVEGFKKQRSYTLQRPEG